ncbi:MAG TPA: hypothetical protein VNJ46_00230 [Gaiellaceae bacterium]|nr:hypothetical protein [Gaiellaceae bacterium]
MSVASVAVTAAQGAGRTLDRLLERPRAVLGALAAAQLAGTLALALSVTHNGWVWFQGGDQIVNTTTGWLVTQRLLPPTEVGYLWPLAQAPITWMTGPTFVQALPVLVCLNVLVLGPLALLCLYGVASAIGGRLLGYWAALLWVVAPYASIPLFVDRYRERWSEHFLPQALGLTAMPDFPSLVLVLAAALFCCRSLVPGRLPEAVLAGLLAGAAGGLKPANYLFCFGPVLAYLAARRWREGLLFGASLLPSLLVLALWKERGLGYVPALTLEQARLAAGAELPFNLDQYLELDLDHWRAQMNYLREFFWSARLAQWAPFAGLLAVLRLRRGALAALLAGWLGAFLLVKGFSPRADIQANTFWRLLLPAWPAYLLLVASIPLLAPTLPRLLGPRIAAPPGGRVRWRWVALAAAVTAALPAAATAVTAKLRPPSPPALVQETATETTILTPVDEGIRLRAGREGGAVRLSWSDPDWRAEVFYRVYRTPSPAGDVECHTRANVAWDCYFKSELVATTRERAYIDPAPPPGAVYRLGVGTNWANDPDEGDVFALSPPARAPAPAP